MRRGQVEAPNFVVLATSGVAGATKFGRVVEDVV